MASEARSWVVPADRNVRAPDADRNVTQAPSDRNVAANDGPVPLDFVPSTPAELARCLPIRCGHLFGAAHSAARLSVTFLSAGPSTLMSAGKKTGARA